MTGLFEYLKLFLPDWPDLIQIALVAYLIYYVLKLYGGTRAFQILFGLVFVMGVYALAVFFQFRLIEAILSQAFTYAAFALIVVFQPELRSALARLGRSRVLNVLTRLEQRSEIVADEIARAAERLSQKRIGAIIAVERELALDEFIEKSGTPLRADVSADLLTTIFTPRSPLHDGAVVIRGGEIIAAGVTLPLSQFPLSDRSLGTRHSAAVGLSEETDAFVVVVSEETSQISLARRGVLRRGLRPDQLRDRLAADSDGGEASRSALEPGRRPDGPDGRLEELVTTHPIGHGEGPEPALDAAFEGEDEAPQTV